MQAQSPSYLRGALIGGAIAGALSGLPITNCCCVLWGFLGGGLAAQLAAKTAPRFGGNEGLLAGLAAGGVGFVVQVVLWTLVNLLLGRRDMDLGEGLPPDTPEWLRDFAEGGGSLVVVALVAGAVLLASAAAGGVSAGLLIDRRRRPPVDPDEPA